MRTYITKNSPVLFAFLAIVGVLAGKETRANGPEQPIPIWLNWDYNCHALDENGIITMVKEAKAAGVQGISLRITNKGALNYRTKIGQPYTERLDAFGKDYDPLRILVAACRAEGIGSSVGIDLFEGAYDKLLNDKPFCAPKGLPGKPPFEGTFCYAEPDVTQYWLSIIAELAAYQPDRMFFCTKSCHTPNGAVMARNKDSGFNAPAIERYRALYGDSVPLDQFDRKKFAAIHGDFLVGYLTAVHRLLKKEGIEMVVGATVSGRLQVGGNMLLDYRKLIAAGAADAIAIGNSRGEYNVFNSESGQDKFRDIATACRERNIRLYPYVIASGSYYATFANRHGYNALLNYLPKHMQYLQALGGDGVIIHDLDLIAFDPVLRKHIWSAIGSRVPVARLRQGVVPIPDILDTMGMRHTVEDNPVAVKNGSFEYRHTGFGTETPRGWTADTLEGGGVAAIYDWKVLHGSPHSGRNADGRSSVMLYVKEQPVGRQASGPHAGSWKTVVTLPERRHTENRLVRIQIHGEELKAIEAAGMHIGLLDREHRLIRTVDVPAPTEGSFDWAPIQTMVGLEPAIASLAISLYLRGSSHTATPPTGRLWFDKFELKQL